MEFSTTPPTEQGFYWIVRGDRIAVAAITTFQREVLFKPELTPARCGDWNISIAECVLVGRQKVPRVRIFGDKERLIHDPKLKVLLWGARLPWHTPDVKWPKLTEQINELCEPSRQARRAWRCSEEGKANEQE